MNSIGAWWASVSGVTKGWIEGFGAAVLTSAADVAIQELTAGGLDMSALDYKQVAGAALIAGLVYVRAHLTGLTRNPDGSPVQTVPADGSVLVQPHG